MLLGTTLRSRYTLGMMRPRIETALPHVLKCLGTHAPAEIAAIRFVSAVAKDEACVAKLSTVFSAERVASAAKDMSPRCVSLLADALLATHHACWDTYPTHTLAMTACATEMKSKDVSAVRDALACLLRVSISASLKENFLIDIVAVLTKFSGDSFVNEAVFSIAYNAIIKREGQEREALLRALHKTGIHIGALEHITNFQDAILSNRALTLLAKMVAVPEVRKVVFPSNVAGAALFLPFLEHNCGEIDISEEAIEHAITILARVLMSKEDVVPTTGIDVWMAPYLTTLLRSPNARTSGNAALVTSHLASVDIASLVTKVPGLVEALLDAIKNARDASFKTTETKTSAARDDILSSSEVENKIASSVCNEKELLMAQKNAGVALGRLAVVQGCRATLTALKGFEILHTVVKTAL